MVLLENIFEEAYCVKCFFFLIYLNVHACTGLFLLFLNELQTCKGLVLIIPE